MTSESFNFNLFIKDSINTLTKPKEYFSTMKLDGGFGVPVLKALIYGTISGVFTFLWSLLKIGAVTGGVFGGAIGIMAFFWAIIGAVIGLFIGAVITLIISAICGGSTDYEANARVTASLMVLMPISALLGFFGGVLGSVIGLVINLYGLYLLFQALAGALKAKEATAKVINFVLAGILVIIFIVGFGARKAANKFMKDFGIDIEESMEEYGKDMEKGLKDLTKDLEEAIDNLDEEE